MNPQRLLTHLHRAGDYGYFWTLPGKESQWFKTNSSLPAINGHNTYFGVNPTAAAKGKHQRATVNDIVAVNCLFSEFDVKDFGSKPAIFKHLETLPSAPSVIVDSGGGFHCYWLLKEPFIIATDQDRNRAKATQAQWVKFVGGDPAAKDLARVLRVPGSKNLKYQPARPVEFVTADYSLLYSFDDLAKLCKPAKRRPPRPQPVFTIGGDLERVKDALERLNPSRADNYHSWVEIGMCLSELGATGLYLWDVWSQQSDKWEPGKCEKKWRSFTPGNGLTIASLFYWANQDNPRPWADHQRRDDQRPKLKRLTFDSPIEPAEFEMCPDEVERASWTSEDGAGTGFYYCNDPLSCDLCRRRHAIKLGYWLNLIAKRAYVSDGLPSYAAPKKNEIGLFESASPGRGRWYGKVLSWGREKRNFVARYRRAKPGNYPKPEVYPILDGGNKYVALSLAPFEDMELIELTDDLLKRIAIGAKGTRASLLFAPPRKQLALALPRYTFETPAWLDKRGLVESVQAAHSVTFCAAIREKDIYTSFKTTAKNFGDIETVLDDIGRKTVGQRAERIRGPDDKAPDYTLRHLSITPESKATYLAVFNAGREGDKATILVHKLRNMPTLPRWKKRVDKDIYEPFSPIDLSTRQADDNGQEWLYTLRIERDLRAEVI